MPLLPGEERVQSVFADVHYYFTTPTPRPLHHRFDKGSYFYVYHNATRRSGRLEIANNAGTPQQDAFHGGLEGVKLRYSYKFPTLLTLIVDPNDLASSSPSSSPAKDAQEWRLASADPRDQGQYLFRLHTLDIYFWTLDDATAVVETARRLLRPDQLDIVNAPRKSSNPHDSMSPVVRQLETVAVSDPAYGNGQTRNAQNAATTLPPPVTNIATSRQSPSSYLGSSPRSASIKSNETPASFSPMAYNPAAPAAPEPIAHREKTPPPEDATGGTGLAAAAYADHSQTYPGSHQQPYPGVTGLHQSATGYGSPPPPSAYATTPVNQPFQNTTSVTSVTSPHRGSAASPQAVPRFGATGPPDRQHSLSQQGYAAPPQDPNAHFYGPSTQPGQAFPIQSPPLESPGSLLYGSAQPHQQHQPLAHLQPQYADYLQSRVPAQSHVSPPPGGYSAYSYAQQPQPQYHHHHHHEDEGGRYDVHGQVYRPTKEEDQHGHGKSSAQQDDGSSGKKPTRKLEETAGKLDKKVGGFLRRLDKKL